MVRKFPSKLPAKPVTRILKFLKSFQFIVFALLCMGLLLASYSELPFLKPLRTNFQDVSASTWKSVSTPFESLQKFFKGLSSYLNLREAYKKLQTENKTLLTWKEAAEYLALENKKLREALRVLPSFPRSYLTVPVLGNYSNSYVKTLVIEGGKKQGFREKQPVLYGTQIIGRLLEVGEKSSRVLLITDFNSRIPVENQTLATKGILTGTDGPLLKLTHLQGLKKVVPGDHLFSTGEGGIFPKGLKVATVQSLDGDEVTASPTLDLDSLNYVQVLREEPISFPPKIQE